MKPANMVNYARAVIVSKTMAWDNPPVIIFARFDILFQHFDNNNLSREECQFNQIKL
jgi:hypothetical protein